MEVAFPSPFPSQYYIVFLGLAKYLKHQALHLGHSSVILQLIPSSQAALNTSETVLIPFTYCDQLRFVKKQ